MARKQATPTPEQIANDPSLRWCPYRRWELVWSDAHGQPMRFHGWEGEQARLATLAMGVVEGPAGLVPADSIRRPSVMAGYVSSP